MNGKALRHAIAMNLSKAFDSVLHNLLLAKLKGYGFGESALVRSVPASKVDVAYSDWKQVKIGLPQGTLLGPLLFNIFMNDVNYFI